MTNSKPSKNTAVKQSVKEDLKKPDSIKQKNQEMVENEKEAFSDDEEEQKLIGSSGDSMAPAPSTKNDDNYGKGKNIPTNPSGLV